MVITNVEEIKGDSRLEKKSLKIFTCAEIEAKTAARDSLSSPSKYETLILRQKRTKESKFFIVLSYRVSLLLFSIEVEIFNLNRVSSTLKMLSLVKLASKAAEPGKIMITA